MSNQDENKVESNTMDSENESYTLKGGSGGIHRELCLLIDLNSWREGHRTIFHCSVGLLETGGTEDSYFRKECHTQGQSGETRR